MSTGKFVLLTQSAWAGNGGGLGAITQKNCYFTTGKTCGVDIICQKYYITDQKVPWKQV